MKAQRKGKSHLRTTDGGGILSNKTWVVSISQTGPSLKWKWTQAFVAKWSLNMQIPMTKTYKTEF